MISTEVFDTAIVKLTHLGMADQDKLINDDIIQDLSRFLAVQLGATVGYYENGVQRFLVKKSKSADPGIYLNLADDVQRDIANLARNWLKKVFEEKYGRMLPRQVGFKASLTTLVDVQQNALKTVAERVNTTGWANSDPDCYAIVNYIEQKYGTQCTSLRELIEFQDGLVEKRG